MAVSNTISIEDLVTPELRALIEALQGRNINPVIGQAAANLTRAHLFELDKTRPNEMGGDRTHFYSGAAKATSWSLGVDYVLVSVAAQGMAQRFFGGTIHAKPGHALTVPACAEAYGHRAREFDYLRMAKLGDMLALVEAERNLISIGKRGVKDKGKGTGRVYYWLVPSVHQDPDTSVLPTEAEYMEAIEAGLQEYSKGFAA